MKRKVSESEDADERETKWTVSEGVRRQLSTSLLETIEA